MPFKIIPGDFMKQEAEIMVIPTVCDHFISPTATGKRVFREAGFDEMYEARKEHGILKNGEIAVTEGFNLKAKNVIHACVPVLRNKTDRAEAYNKVMKCYSRSLAWAERSGAESISFTLLGIGFTRETAEHIAVSAIKAHLKMFESCLNVYLVIPPSEEPVYEEQEQTKSESPVIEKYIDCYAEYDIKFEENFRNSGISRGIFCRKYVEKLFSKYITNYSQLADAIDYNKTNLSKFKTGQTLHPDKHRVIAMAIYMGLSDEERYNFIHSVGYNKYPEDERDRIVEKLMRSGRRDFDSVNNELCRINPAFDLKAESRKGKKKDKSKEKE